MAPITVAAATPMPKPAPTRPRVTSVCRCNSPLFASSTKVWKMTDGGGASRPVDQPIWTMNSHAAPSTTGTSKPIAGRMRRAQRRDGARSAAAASAGLRSAATVMATRDMGPAAIAMRSNFTSPRPRGEVKASVLGPRHVAVVDQIVERLLDVDIGRDDAGLLQRQPGLQDGVALLRPDLVEGELGALLELDVGNRVGQLGDGLEHVLLGVVIGEAVFARLFVDPEHALGQVRIGLQELLARIEDAPGVGGLVAVEQPGAVLDL